jgi:hypothetical protein
LRPAIAEATRRLDDVAGDLSFAVCQRLKPAYCSTLTAALQAISDLSAALDRAAAIRSAIHDKGYRVSDIVLPNGLPPAARALGDPANVGSSQAWFWRKMLTEHGII